MPQVLTRNVPDEHVQSLKASAAEAGTSVEAVCRALFEAEHKRRRKREALAAAEQIVGERRRWLEQSGVDPESLPDSVELLRESRSDEPW